LTELLLLSREADLLNLVSTFDDFCELFQFNSPIIDEFFN
jgi:hypothetical protein